MPVFPPITISRLGIHKSVRVDNWNDVPVITVDPFREGSVFAVISDQLICEILIDL